MVLVLLEPWLTFNCDGPGAKAKSGVITISLIAIEEVMPRLCHDGHRCGGATGTVLASESNNAAAPVTGADGKVP